MRKNKKKIRKKINYKIFLLFLPLIIAVLFFAAHPHGLLADGTYQNQEKIPGASGQTSEFTDYMKQVIGFGYAVIGILAMFMLCIGAYQYLMAAGNLAKAESAKNTISSAILGLILGIMSWVILFTINPDLVAMKGLGLQTVNFSYVSPYTGSTGAGTATDTGAAGTTSANAGKCVEGTGSCSSENFSCFGNRAKNASIVCNAESGGAAIGSSTDKCGGRSVSWGIMQINLSCNGVGGLNCSSAYSCCYGTGGCNKSNCQITNESLAQQCETSAKDSTNNIQAACSVYKDQGWGAWGAAKKCGVTG